MALIVTVLPSFDVSYGNALMALIVTVLSYPLRLVMGIL